MSLLTIVIGALLLVLGIGAYLITGQSSVTALIPCFFGLAYLLLGFIGLRKPSIRKHVMHVAAAISVVGIAGNVSAIAAMGEILAGQQVNRPAAVIARFIMAVICTVHLLAGVNSFLQARLRPSGT